MIEFSCERERKRGVPSQRGFPAILHVLERRLQQIIIV